MVTSKNALRKHVPSLLRLYSLDNLQKSFCFLNPFLLFSFSVDLLPTLPLFSVYKIYKIHKKFEWYEAITPHIFT